MNEELPSNNFGKLVVLVLLLVVTYLVFKSLNLGVTTIDLTKSAVPNGLDKSIFVDVSGAVVAPGVYKLPFNARVIDALAASQGYALNANLIWTSKQLNLASVLPDEAKIYVPFSWDVIEASSSINSLNINNFKTLESAINVETASNSGGSSVNVNSASKDELMALDGIGDKYSDYIIDNRPYTSLTDFKSRSGVSGAAVDKIVGELNFE